MIKFDAHAFLAKYLEQDAILARQPNGHPTSPWWLEQIGRIVTDAGKKRRFVARVGRRGGKSSTMCRLAVCWALHGPHRITPGDVGVIPIVSVDRREASARITMLRSILTTIGVPFDERGDTIALQDRPIEFRVHTCSISGVVGFTGIMLICDEMAHWEAREDRADPAKEVVGNLMPTMATQPFGFGVFISTPWGFDDHHAELFDRGDTPEQNVAHAPSWIANPSLPEEQTHRDEPDEREWLRQYGAEPSQNVSAAFNRDLLLRALAKPPLTEGGLVCCIDMARGDSSGRTTRDHRAMAIVRLSEQTLSVIDCWEYPHEMLTDDVVTHVAEHCAKHKIKSVWSDGFEAQSVLFRKHGLDSVIRQYSAPLKSAAVAAFRRMLSEDRVSLGGVEKLAEQLSQIKERLAPNGALHYPNTNGLDAACAAVITPLVIVAHDASMYPAGGVKLNYSQALANLRAMGGAAALFGMRNVHVNPSMHRADCNTYGCPGCL